MTGNRLRCSGGAKVHRFSLKCMDSHVTLMLEGRTKANILDSWNNDRGNNAREYFTFNMSGLRKRLREGMARHEHKGLLQAAYEGDS